MSDTVVVTPAVLRDLAPVRPEGSAHKGMRGRVLIIGGSSEMPGAALLAGIAALRAGAGVLQVATVESAAFHLATAIPEARVIGLPEGPGGEIARSAASRLVDLAGAADAVLVGPGMTDDDELAELVPALLQGASEVATVVDARALAAVTPQLLAARDGATVLTPNAKEACTMIEADVDDVQEDPLGCLRTLVSDFHCAVTLRGGETFTTAPGEPVYRDESGSPGLGTSGSGDVLTGFLTGLLARGTAPVGAAVWAVHVHAQSGQRLSSRVGPLGYLARELLDEMAAVATELGA
jgi:ADP-dependent NAD(P)H-hydrate dehydratase